MVILPEGQMPYMDTDETPDEIMGEHYQLFAAHYRAWKKHDGSETALAKAFSQEELKLIGKINNRLFDNGYRIKEISESGQIKWFVMSVPMLASIDPDKRRSIEDDWGYEGEPG